MPAVASTASIFILEFRIPVDDAVFAKGHGTVAAVDLGALYGAPNWSSSVPAQKPTRAYNAMPLPQT
jgi:hypothetical protein